MRTEDLLRDALAEAAKQPHPTSKLEGRILTAITARRAPRSALLVLALGTLVVLLAVAVPTLLQLRGTAPAAPAGDLISDGAVPAGPAQPAGSARSEQTSGLIWNTAGCGEQPLASRIGATLHARGGAVLTATLTITTETSLADGAKTRVLLTDVSVLAGRFSGSGGWLRSSTYRGTQFSTGVDGSLWAPDGRVVVLVLDGNPPGPNLTVAPLVDGQVVLSAAGCWTDAGLPGKPYTGPLEELPGTNALAFTQGSRTAIPYATFVAAVDKAKR